MLSSHRGEMSIATLPSPYASLPTPQTTPELLDAASHNRDRQLVNLFAHSPSPQPLSSPPSSPFSPAPRSDAADMTRLKDEREMEIARALEWLAVHQAPR